MEGTGDVGSGEGEEEEVEEGEGEEDGNLSEEKRGGMGKVKIGLLPACVHLSVFDVRIKSANSNLPKRVTPSLSTQRIKPAQWLLCIL